ncbi:MAG: ligase-associated DNA damage response endonuclease PdeM [Luteolibacter sp.]
MNSFPNLSGISLLSEGAVFLTGDSTLIVADVHLGKSAAFRAQGLPVPEGDSARDLARLTALVEKSRARHLVIAGDLFHAPSGMTHEIKTALAEFMSRLEIPITLVVGNHDAKIRQLPAGLTITPQLDLQDQLRIVHDPAHVSGERLHIAGHWHPVVKIPDGRRTSLRLPCFLLRDHTLILPAFGSFTGGSVLQVRPDDRVFVALRDQVVELPESLIA